jgi:hypothetical protein
LTGWPAKPCAHTDAVDRIEVAAVLSLPKMPWMSSYGAR